MAPVTVAVAGLADRAGQWHRCQSWPGPAGNRPGATDPVVLHRADPGGRRQGDLVAVQQVLMYQIVTLRNNRKIHEINAIFTNNTK